MPSRDIIVIGGSTGAIDVLKQVSGGLRADLPAAVFVVVHVGMHGENGLARVLGESGPLRTRTAEEGQVVEPGWMTVAAADRHLILQDGRVRLGRGPRENLTRPAVDPLFRSAAIAYGPRVMGVVLSGWLDDGAAGLAAVKQCGGIAIVQSPADAAAEEMPRGALEACEVDYRAPAAELARLLAKLAREPAGPALLVPPALQLEVDIALGQVSNSPKLRQMADPSTLACPGCGGVLSELHDKSTLRFRCQVGHAYTADIVDREMERPTMEALGTALRIIESRATLVERMAAHATANNRIRSAAEFTERAREYRAQAEILSDAIVKSVEGSKE